jgi:putative transcriptional regulator
MTGTEKGGATMDLTGKLLIAMPGMGDPRFEHAVVFICSHGADGAMGLIVNKPMNDVRLSDLLQQLEIQPQFGAGNARVRFGGPVEGGRGFILHSTDYTSSLQSLQVSDQFSMTATLDILEDIAMGTGPKHALMMLGYAGWGPDQLEAEIAMNGWLTADADPDLVFAAADADKWAAALKSLGVDPLSLSASAGRA